MPRWPAWWDWELELTPHVFERMEDRGFTELDLRAMVDGATAFRPDFDPERYVIETRHGGMAWEVIVEPDPIRSSLVVITAYQVERR